MANKEDLIKYYSSLNNESYLVTISNMGTFKRAQKDFAPLEYVFEEDCLIFNTEGFKVILPNDVKNITCSCPSPIICKHVLQCIMSVIVVDSDAQNSNESNFNEQKTQLFDFSTLTEDDLVAYCGKKNYETAMDKFFSSEIIENGNEFIVNGCRVVFTPKMSLNDAVCSCKNKNCLHKAIACIYKLEKENKIVLDDLKNYVSLSEENLALLKNLKEYLINIPKFGIYGLSLADCENIMFFSISLRSVSDRLSKNLSALSTTVRDCLENQVYFDSDYASKLFCKIFNTVSAALLKINEPKFLTKILGEGDRVYLKVQSGSFIGLGSCPFETASGFLGVTTYLYWIEKKCIATFTRVMPTIYEDDIDVKSWIKNLYTSSVNENGVNCKVLGQGNFNIYNFKVSGDMRLTFSSESLFLKLDSSISNAEVTKFSDILKINESYNDYFEASQAEYFIADVAQVEFDGFNSSSGCFEFNINNEGESIPLEVYFSPVTENAIEVLEKGLFFNKIVLKKINRTFIPISLVNDNKILDFYFKEI